MANRFRVLIVDPDGSTGEELCRHFREHDYRFTSVATPEEAREALHEQEFDAVLADSQADESGGLALLRELRGARPHLPVILIAENYESRTAIEAVKAGAFDFLPKPWEEEEIFSCLGEAVRCARSMVEPVAIDPLDRGEPGSLSLVGTSRPMLDVYKALGRLSPTPVTVLIRGETGTGKELVARALYQHGHRAHKPFITVNCAAIPKNLIESELFGHEKGAFTGATHTRLGRFEQANGATLFLDEIGDLDLTLQAKLLRVLQEKRFQRVGGSEEILVDVRIIAATHQPIERMIDEGTFREDLFYRLNVATIALPPLREREGDMPLLVGHFVRRSAEEFLLPPVAVTPDALALLEKAPLPGNVRELQNIVRKAVLAARGFRIDAAIIREILGSENRTGSPPPVSNGWDALCREIVDQHLDDPGEGAHPAFLETTEPILFSAAMEACEGNLSRAATVLGISRITLREKLKRYDLR